MELCRMMCELGTSCVSIWSLRMELILTLENWKTKVRVGEKLNPAGDIWAVNPAMPETRSYLGFSVFKYESVFCFKASWVEIFVNWNWKTQINDTGIKHFGGLLTLWGHLDIVGQDLRLDPNALKELVWNFKKLGKLYILLAVHDREVTEVSESITPSGSLLNVKMANSFGQMTCTRLDYLFILVAPPPTLCLSRILRTWIYFFTLLSREPALLSIYVIHIIYSSFQSSKKFEHLWHDSGSTVIF